MFFKHILLVLEKRHYEDFCMEINYVVHKIGTTSYCSETGIEWPKILSLSTLFNKNLASNEFVYSRRYQGSFLAFPTSQDKSDFLFLSEEV